MSFRGETSFTRLGVFTPTIPTFATSEEALEFVELRVDKSSLIADYRVAEVQDEVSHEMKNGRAVLLRKEIA